MGCIILTVFDRPVFVSDTHMRGLIKHKGVSLVEFPVSVGSARNVLKMPHWNTKSIVTLPLEHWNFGHLA